MEELWKSCPYYPNYLISNRGRVFDLTTCRIVKVWQNNEGYQLVKLRRENANWNEKIHRLVALAFIPNQQGYCKVKHINGIKNDNRAINLEWC